MEIYQVITLVGNLGRSATGIDLSLNHLRPEHVSVQISFGFSSVKKERIGKNIYC